LLIYQTIPEEYILKMSIMGDVDNPIYKMVLDNCKTYKENNLTPIILYNAENQKVLVTSMEYLNKEMN
jgi:hypothetical protein